MRKYTQKELKNMVALGMAEDVTRANNEDYERIIKKKIIFLRSDIPLVFMVAMECYSKDTKPEHIMP